MTMTQQRPESRELSMLIKLLKMTTSPHDHEALSAMRLANTQLLKLGTDWEDLLNSKVTLIADPFTSVPKVSPSSVGFPGKPSPPPQPPKPAPPVYYTDPTVIQPLFDDLMFAALSPQTVKQVNDIEQRWMTYKRLDAADFSQLSGIFSAYAPIRTKRRRSK